MQACLQEVIFLFLFIRRQPNMRMKRSGIRINTASYKGKNLVLETQANIIMLSENDMNYNNF